MRKLSMGLLIGALCIAGVVFVLPVAISLCYYTLGGIRGHICFSALDAARPSAPYIADFLRIIPNGKVRYIYFDGSGDPGFDVEGELYGRYELTMQLPVRFDTFHRKVTGYGAPNFYLVEIESREGGMTSYKSVGERHLGVTDW